jgi:transposase InsO family protein
MDGSDIRIFPTAQATRIHRDDLGMDVSVLKGPEFVARDLRQWLQKTGAKILYIEPGSPWENGYCESFNSKLRGPRPATPISEAC